MSAPGRGTPRFGATTTERGVRFAAWSGAAERLWLCLFDASGSRETERLAMQAEENGVHAVTVPGLSAGARYGLRADGPWDPQAGLWFDPGKLLVDPYAVEIDRPYAYDPRLAAPRGEAGDTAPLVPKALLRDLAPPIAPRPPLFRPGGLVYELSVRAFSRLHPDIPEKLRGTVGALAHPAILDHLLRLGVGAVELMPITAWIDERHLGPLGLTNAWGYNPVTFMALDPRLAPGGIAELRDTVAALRQAGIGVVLDVVFNHTGEGDEKGPTLSLRGLDNLSYYRHRPDDPGALVNDTGTGNTLATQHPVVMEMILDALRHFVTQAGVDGFRFDLATVLGRGEESFAQDAPLLAAMRADPLLGDRVLIAEPWDVGPGGYQLGNFGKPFLEWNDRFRDDVRRFWRGDAGMIGRLATRLAGSSDVFGGSQRAEDTRTVDFLAAHDGMALADLVAYKAKRNEENGEGNRDGRADELSWNCGEEGDSAASKVRDARRRDVKALLSTLFASRGTIMLTAGDEFGRSQRGNNNAYAQDNGTTWLDWQGRDRELEAHATALADLRRAFACLSDTAFLTGAAGPDGLPDVEWLSELGRPLSEGDWNDQKRARLAMLLARSVGGRLAVMVNGDRRGTVFTLPERDGFRWQLSAAASPGAAAVADLPVFRLPGRTVAFAEEGPA